MSTQMQMQIQTAEMGKGRPQPWSAICSNWPPCKASWTSSDTRCPTTCSNCSGTCRRCFSSAETLWQNRVSATNEWPGASATCCTTRSRCRTSSDTASFSGPNSAGYSRSCRKCRSTLSPPSKFCFSSDSHDRTTSRGTSPGCGRSASSRCSSTPPSNAFFFDIFTSSPHNNQKNTSICLHILFLEELISIICFAKNKHFFLKKIKKIYTN